MAKKPTPFLKVIRPGTWISVQDEGRLGYRHLGVPCSGAMDMVSYAKSNHLVGNPSGLAVLEIMGPGTVFEILSDGYIAFVGASAEIFTGEQKLPLDVMIPIREGQQISIGRFLRGGILYLAVQGGITAPVVMGSRSTMPYFPGSTPVKGTVYTIDEQQKPGDAIEQISGGIDNFQDEQTIEVMKGPEYKRLYEPSKKVLEASEITITNQINRMGFRLHGPVLHKEENRDMLTSAVLPGTIQLLPDGQMIALMRDAQTTGGYPRILQITDVGIHILAQKRPGESIRFTLAE